MLLNCFDSWLQEPPEADEHIITPPPDQKVYQWMPRPCLRSQSKGVGSICDNLSSGCVESLIAGDKKDKGNKASRIQKHPKQQESTGSKAKNKVP